MYKRQAGIREYYRQFGGGNASSEDFRRVMESASGRDLEWFFKQWLERPGYPILASTLEWDGQAREARITVTQEQPDAWPAFRFPLDVEVALPDGARERVRMAVEGRSASVRLPAPVAPESVRLDPDGWLLHRREGR